MHLFIKDMTAFLPAHYLFEKTVFPFASGVKVFESEDEARQYTVRRKNVSACNQWFRVLIPSREHFLELNQPLAPQPPNLLESLLSAQALDAISEKKPDYIEKRKFFYSLESVEAYLMHLIHIFHDDSLSRTVSYISYFGVAGIILPQYDHGETFLLFDAQQNIIIKEIKREKIPHTILVS
jgi:hypothetical protein